MKLPDGREAVARLEFPLPLTVAAELMKAVAETMERLGWTDVVLLTDGTSRMAARPPHPPVDSQHRGVLPVDTVDRDAL